MTDGPILVEVLIEDTGPQWRVNGTFYADRSVSSEELLAGARWLIDQAYELDRAVRRHPAAAVGFAVPT